MRIKQVAERVDSGLSPIKVELTTSPYREMDKEYDAWYKAQFTDEEILKEVKPPFRIDTENVLEFDTIIVPNE